MYLLLLAYALGQTPTIDRSEFDLVATTLCSADFDLAREPVFPDRSAKLNAVLKPPPRWVDLSDAPGWQLWGRVENGYAAPEGAKRYRRAYAPPVTRQNAPMVPCTTGNCPRR